jgi:hypothetical protein
MSRWNGNLTGESSNTQLFTLYLWNADDLYAPDLEILRSPHNFLNAKRYRFSVCLKSNQREKLIARGFLRVGMPKIGSHSWKDRISVENSHVNDTPSSSRAVPLTASAGECALNSPNETGRRKSHLPPIDTISAPESRNKILFYCHIEDPQLYLILCLSLCLDRWH